MERAGDKLIWPGGRLTRLLDGTVSFGPDFFPDPRGAAIPERVDLPVQCFLLERQGQAPVLIDTGSGALYGDNGGGLPGALAAAKVKAEDIGAVLMTHLHGDHCGGLLSLGFPNAKVYAEAGELNYWPTQDHPAARFLAGAGDKVRAVQNGDSPLPGIRLWSLPGHTPGHAGYVIDAKIAIIGDVMHRADIQLPDPQIATKFDVDRDLATKTRLEALKEIAAKQWVVCGGHFQHPENGAPFMRLKPRDGGYQGLSL